MTINLNITIPSYILGLDLSMNHKFILALADTFKDNGCFMSNAKIAKLVGLSASRVSHIISELVNMNLLTRKITYKEDSKEVDKRTIFLNKTIRKVQETIKKAASKAKELKQGYTATKTTVGTQEVEQVTFGRSQYTKPYNANNKPNKNARFCCINKLDGDYSPEKIRLYEELESQLIERECGGGLG